MASVVASPAGSRVVFAGFESSSSMPAGVTGMEGDTGDPDNAGVFTGPEFSDLPWDWPGTWVAGDADVAIDFDETAAEWFVADSGDFALAIMEAAKATPAVSRTERVKLIFSPKAE